MRIIPKSIQAAWEKKAHDHLHDNYCKKYELVKNAVDNGWETAAIAQQFCGLNIFLGIVIILAANQIYNERKVTHD